MEYMEQQEQNRHEGDDEEQRQIIEALGAKDLHLHRLDRRDCADVEAAYRKYKNSLVGLGPYDEYYVMHGSDVVIITWGGGLLSQILQFTPNAQ